MKFFELQHTRYYDDNSFSDQKLIGIYSSKELAEQKQRVYSEKEGFINHPQGFSITEYSLDTIGFLEGFTDLYTK